jgi:hypothetical protein
MNKFLCFFALLFINGCGEGSNLSVRVDDNSKVQIVQKASPSSTPNRIEEGRIIPGKGIDKIQLGNSREQAVQSLGKPSEEYQYDYEPLNNPCNRKEMHWLQLGITGNGFFAYLRDGVVFQIDVSSNHYATPEGISVYTPIDEVLSKYDSLQGFELMGSAGEINGGKNLWYLVEQSQGIAFEMYYDKKEKKRKVWTISVFEPNTNFEPDGCVSPPQKLMQIENHKLH